MIEQETVLILGAGASWPYGLPKTTELRKKICINFADRIKMLVENRYQAKVEEMYQQALEFTNAFYGSSDSIDLWLMNNTKYLDMGKHAIITYILQGEHDGDLREKAPHDDQDWYTFLWKKMKDDYTTKQSYNSFSNNKIDFITFNYDRSLEQYLFECISNRFYTHDISDKEIINQLKSRRIIHVYGKIAPLDWEDKLGSLSYGADPGNRWLKKYGKNIKIIEEAEKTQDVHDAVYLIANAKRIFFLGFGYTAENLELLKIPDVLNGNQKIYGTAYNYSPNEIEETKSIFPNIHYSNRNILNCDCLKLLKQFLR